MAFEANALVNAQLEEARATGPRDFLTQGAIVLNGVLGLLFLPTIVLVPVSTFILGLAVTATFGLLLFPLSVIWLPFLGVLLGTSWLWIKIPVLRPFLLLPGITIARVADVYISLIPDMGEKYQKVLKMAFCDNWPVSWLLWQISLRDQRDNPGAF
ncbi:MAG: hypothetical protein V1724_02360 [Chloroflexota bacterium]